MDQFSVTPLLFVLFVIAAFVWNLYNQAQRTEELRQQGGRAQGVVVGNKIKWGRHTVVRAVVQFRTEEGQLVEAEDELSTNTIVPKYAKGQQVVVYYDKINPQSFVIITPGNFG